MSIVSNSSPLINLSRIGQLDLLYKLYKELVIPEAVRQEIVVKGAGQPGAEEIKDATWIETRSAKNRQLVRSLQQELDAGEAEAIALSLEVESELLLMDERLGRETARHLGIRFIGLIGILIESKRKGIINDLKSYLDELRNIAGFRISDTLYTHLLQREGEI